METSLSIQPRFVGRKREADLNSPAENISKYEKPFPTLILHKHEVTLSQQGDYGDYGDFGVFFSISFGHFWFSFMTKYRINVAPKAISVDKENANTVLKI